MNGPGEPRQAPSRRGPAIGVALALALVLPACGGASGPPAATPTDEVEPEFTMLRASGRRIVNKAGQAVRLRGLNSVRLPLRYAPLWDLEQGTPRPEGFAFLDRVVDWCERHRRWLFFDLHCAPGGQNAGNISDSDGVARLYADPANQDATAALWSTTS